MTIIEIVLLVVGMAFILASFWVAEKLSPDELHHISELSKEEMGVMLERELEKSKQRVVDIVEDTIDASKERTERALEKQTNEKIMAINEYSDTVIEKMNKTHNEIMFLYSMLNDKHTELTDFTSSLTQQLQDLKAQEEEMTNGFIEQIKNQVTIQAQNQKAQPAAAEQAAPKPLSGAASSREPSKEQAPAANASAPAQDSQGTPAEPAAQEAADKEAEEKEVNVKDEIIRLYEQGRDSVAIAKNLGLGVGEVRLILGLYKGD
ncbi:MAG: hypothetical protein K2N87_20320 [Eubacterium sp.]|nr:hypothetical protein [Eubacterium sp.]